MRKTRLKPIEAAVNVSLAAPDEDEFVPDESAVEAVDDETSMQEEDEPQNAGQELKDLGQAAELSLEELLAQYPGYEPGAGSSGQESESDDAEADSDAEDEVEVAAAAMVTDQDQVEEKTSLVSNRPKRKRRGSIAASDIMAETEEALAPKRPRIDTAVPTTTATAVAEANGDTTAATAMDVPMDADSAAELPADSETPVAATAGGVDAVEDDEEDEGQADEELSALLSNPDTNSPEAILEHQANKLVGAAACMQGRKVGKVTVAFM